MEKDFDSQYKITGKKKEKNKGNCKLFALHTNAKKNDDCKFFTLHANAKKDLIKF